MTIALFFSSSAPGKSPTCDCGLGDFGDAIGETACASANGDGRRRVFRGDATEQGEEDGCEFSSSAGEVVPVCDRGLANGVGDLGDTVGEAACARAKVGDGCHTIGGDGRTGHGELDGRAAGVGESLEPDPVAGEN